MAEWPGWSQLGAGYQGLMLPPVNRLLEFGFMSPGHAAILQSALILDYNKHDSRHRTK